MTPVYLLQHLHTLPDGTEDLKTIGIYSNRENAIKAITILTTEDGFCDHKDLISPSKDGITDGFYLDEYELDKDHWSEGFITN